jgi:curved DNA-binding protein CbpA
MATAAAEPDPYLVLGVARTATAAEIRAAYRSLGARYHPDRHQGNPLEELASAKMAEINRAYEILSDPERRAAYDGAGGGLNGGPWPGGFAGGPPAGFSSGGIPGRRFVKIVAALSLLPLLFRFGGLALRLLVALFREAVEGAALIRGSPAALIAMALAMVLLVVALLRRRRRPSKK